MGKHVIHAVWIGKHARVVSSTNKNFKEIEGVVVDETRNTVMIETEKGVKRVQKHGTVFEIDGHEVEVDEILATPEERIRIKVD